MTGRWYGLVAGEVVGPFNTMDVWYHEHAGPDWRARVNRDTGVDPWRVDYTEVGGEVVSTVFLGLDHGWDGGPPVLFETMVMSTGDADRARTLDEARANHVAAVAFLAAMRN